MNLPLLSQGMQNIMIGFCFCLFFAGMTFYLIKHRFKKLKSRKWRLITAMSLLGIILLYFIFYTASNMIGRAQVESRLAEMKALEIPITPDAIIPKPPKNPLENGACFYKAAFALLDADDPWDKLQEREVNRKYGYIKIKNNNGICGYNAADWSESGLKRAKKVLNSKHINLVFSLFSQGAEKPYAVYKRQYKDINTPLPRLTHYRSMFRLIAMRSSCDGLAGKADAGYELIRDGYKSIIQFFNEPYLISQLANTICVRINTKALNVLVSKYGISNARAEELLELLNKLDFNQAMELAIEGEAVILNKDIFEGIMKGKYSSKQLSQEEHLWVNVFQLWPFLYQDYASALSSCIEVRALFKEPFWKIKKEVQKFRQKKTSLMFIAKHLQKAYGFLRIKTARINTEIYAAKLTLALHIYKNNNKHFPEKLEELSPGILKHLPVDPMSGEPFEYKKKGDSFTLDSVWFKERRQRYLKYKKRRK